MQVRQTQLFELAEKHRRAMQSMVMSTIATIGLMIALILTGPEAFRILAIMLAGTTLIFILSIIGFLRTGHELAELDCKVNRPKNQVRSTYDPRINISEDE